MTRTSKIITAFAALSLASSIATTPASAAGLNQRHSGAVTVESASTAIDSQELAAPVDAMSADQDIG